MDQILTRRRDTTYHQEQRFVRSSLIETNQRIGGFNAELSRFRALGDRRDLTDMARAAFGCGNLLARLGSDRLRLEEIVRLFPSHLREHTRIRDVRRSHDAIEAVVVDVLVAVGGEDDLR